MRVSCFLVIIVGAEVVNKPLSGSLAFVKDKDIYVTSEYWRIIVNFGFTEYKEVTTQLRTEIFELQDIVKLTAPAGELQHLKKALNSLESKLRSLKEFLPRADRRRGLINTGGSILKVLFGTTTVMDLEELHSTVDALHRKEEAIVHSLDQQVTYLKQLDGTVRFNFQAVTNLSDALKDVALKAQEGFQDVAAKLAWNNKQCFFCTILAKKWGCLKVID
jgi:hypothetical protein